MEKLTREEKDKFQPSYDCTVFSEAPLDTTMQPESVVASASGTSSSTSFGLTRPTSTTNSVTISNHSGSSPVSDPQGVMAIKWSPPKSHNHQPPPQHHHSHHQHHNVSPTIEVGVGGGSGGEGDDYGGRESPMNSDGDIQSPIEASSGMVAVGGGIGGGGGVVGGGENIPPLMRWSHNNNNHHHPHHHQHHPPSSGASSAPTSFMGLGLNGFSSSNGGGGGGGNDGLNGHSNISPTTSFGSTNGDLNTSFTRGGSHGELDSMMQMQQHHSQHPPLPPQQQPHPQQQPPPPPPPQIPPGLVVPTVLAPESSAVVVAAWLVRNRFGNYVRVFNNFSGEDLLRLTRDDFVQVYSVFG